MSKDVIYQSKGALIQFIGTNELPGLLVEGAIEVGSGDETVSGQTLIKFNTSRAWEFQATGSAGSSQHLELKNTVGVSKNFRLVTDGFLTFKGQDGTMHGAVKCSTGEGHFSRVVAGYNDPSDYEVMLTGSDAGNSRTGPQIQFGNSSNPDQYMVFGAWSSDNRIDTTTRDFHLYGTNTTTGLYFDESAGRFGLLDSTPGYTLDVAGSIRATDQMHVNDGIYVDGMVVLGGTTTLGTGMRAEFRNLGGQTYSSQNGVYYENSSANNTNARTVLTTEATEDYDILGPAVWGSNIYWFWKSTSNTTTYRTITAGASFTFTGQHLSVPLDSNISSSLAEYVGLIAVSSGTQMRFDEITREWVTGKAAVTINETLPRIELANQREDKRVFGVISNRPDQYVINNESGEIEEDQDGTAYLWNDLKQTQIRVNSIGEGAVWVSNINGNLENGDYITTCEIPGLGMKQDDDLLHNYTVAKITQDCDFRINSAAYNVVEFEYSGSAYRKAFVGCTYHCG